ncbi:hypothetical protein ARTHRO9V_160123 [Arthrobacter sp. 9V]|nr:hypothetical protein ARTHRO9V_160123 [Arthrobacter sp. 9V]
MLRDFSGHRDNYFGSASALTGLRVQPSRALLWVVTPDQYLLIQQAYVWQYAWETTSLSPNDITKVREYAGT